MARTLERPPETTVQPGPAAPPKHSHPGQLLVIGFLAILVAIMGLMVVSDPAPEQSLSAEPEPLALTPKSELPVIQAAEGRNWTHAPAVPPPVDRDGQAHLVVEWTASEFTSELDPGNGVSYAAWGFEGSAPGPILRARVGDVIEVRLTNDAQAQHPHNIDFHFATGPGGGAPALSVSPGETATVEVRALAPGIFMYHCATPDIPTHIANGMYGYVIVEPEREMPAVDREFYVVQSEFYATAGTGVATLDMAKLDLEEPTYVVLNGAVGSLMEDNSPTVDVGDRVRIWYGNAGPQLISSFHVIGEIFDRVYREGDLVSAPAQSVQTTLVPAGGATVVDLTIDVPGTYLLVDHAIARSLHKGTVGAIVAEGPDNTEIFEPGANNPPAPPGGDGHGEGEPGGETMVAIPQGAFDPNNAATAYSPSEVTIEVGSNVMWTNSDDVAHTVTADGETFDSGFIDPGQSFTYTFSEPGTFAFHCTPHPWMEGKVIVA